MGKDGKTACRRVVGKDFNREVAECGECVWAIRPKSKGASKWEYRWYSGIWVGMMVETNEHIILTPEWATRTNRIRRKLDGTQR